ncbi:DUF2927 domain-containing protein [Vibrio sp.]|uniref:DUF2927 domain-containing protein n=1 Tax=Vibrio sp. TaxID=678 RepID=UPI00311F6A46
MLCRPRMVLGLLLSLGTTSNAFCANQTWLDAKFVKKAFLEVALKNEYSQNIQRLTKWNKPIRIWIDHKVADQALHDRLANTHIHDLSSITGHPIKRVSKRADANVVWIYTQQSKWQNDIRRELGEEALKYAHGAICKAGYRTNKKTNEIDSAVIIIPVDQAREHGKLLACIVEEVTQAMGLPNDSEAAYPSIFNDETPEDLLSPLDVILLKMLYEPELKSGMSFVETKQAIDTVLNRYQRQGVLKNAVSDAKSTKLYKLIAY